MERRMDHGFLRIKFCPPATPLLICTCPSPSTVLLEQVILVKSFFNFSPLGGMVIFFSFLDCPSMIKSCYSSLFNFSAFLFFFQFSYLLLVSNFFWTCSSSPLLSPSLFICQNFQLSYLVYFLCQFPRLSSSLSYFSINIFMALSSGSIFTSRFCFVLDLIISQ